MDRTCSDADQNLTVVVARRMKILSVAMFSKSSQILVILGSMTFASVTGNKAHSFQHFHGPVEGEGVKVTWQNKHGHEDVDYNAHPKYEFSYGVEDHHTKDSHGQKEHRDGKDVVGEYTLHEPGGNVRTVKYHADHHGGFHAVVHNSGGNDHSGGTYGGHHHRRR